jgi:hypothetical protein
VHTDAPERAAALAGAWGAVDALQVDDMRRQESERAARLARAATSGARCGALAIADGEGVRTLAEGLGAAALPPGVGDAGLADALAALGTPEAVVVVAGAAEGEAAIDSSSAALVRAGSLPAALACLVAMDPSRGAAENAAEMAEVAGAVIAAEVAGGDPGALRAGLCEELASALGAGPALVTVLVGAGAGVEPAQVEAWVREAASGAAVEVDAHHGGQAAPALAIGIE